ncbi:hypothetical protein GCM10011515_24420 [Tsuneonella deserti]|uniref:MnmE helical domain-containing protein n=1 Tax=Tsuneonella deserti TaxID=2035528 RepID=A0ABQ1SAH4_9SPHN|nr:hypothetical protein GCM10011515_24420 [Tsuneonella deserti]
MERPVAIDGVPFVFLDTAGLRDDADNEIESEGIARAKAAFDTADLVLWLGEEGRGPDGSWEIDAKIDLGNHKCAAVSRVSAVTGVGVDELSTKLIDRARETLPVPGQVALNGRQHAILSEAHRALAEHHNDPLILAEYLRVVRTSFDRLTGRASPEDMLDALFARFCIGK